MVAGFAKNITGRFRGWVQRQLISDVPGDLAACEFECKRPECVEEKFAGCERRRRAEACLAEASEKEKQADAASVCPAGVSR